MGVTGGEPSVAVGVRAEPMRTLRILHIANFAQLGIPHTWPHRRYRRRQLADDYYSEERKISNGLVRNQHHVQELSYRDIARQLGLFGSKALGRYPLQRQVLAAAHNYEPQLILLGHTELLSLSTLETLRKNHPDVPLLQWWIDPFPPHQVALLAPRLALLDALFTTSHPAAVAELLGATPQLAKRIHFLPNPCDASIETESACEHPAPQLDVFFAGGGRTARHLALVEQLRAMASELRLGLYVDRDKIYGRRYMKTVGTSRIGINYNSATDAVPMYSSNRLMHLTGNGVLALSSSVPQLERLFPPTEVPCFKDFGEMRQLLHYYLQHDDELRTAARAAQRRAHSLYDASRIARFIVEVGMQEPLGEDYEWRNEILFPKPGS